MRFSLFHFIFGAPLFFIIIAIVVIVVVVAFFSDVFHSTCLLQTISYVTWIMSHLNTAYPCPFGLIGATISIWPFSSKLLGFICELVESSQTVQQHMIQVNIFDINNNIFNRMVVFIVPFYLGVCFRIVDSLWYRSCYKDRHVNIWHLTCSARS